MSLVTHEALYLEGIHSHEPVLNRCLHMRYLWKIFTDDWNCSLKKYVRSCLRVAWFLSCLLLCEVMCSWLAFWTPSGVVKARRPNSEICVWHPTVRWVAWKQFGRTEHLELKEFIYFSCLLSFRPHSLGSKHRHCEFGRQCRRYRAILF